MTDDGKQRTEALRGQKIEIMKSVCGILPIVLTPDTLFYHLSTAVRLAPCTVPYALCPKPIITLSQFLTFSPCTIFLACPATRNPQPRLVH